MSKLSLNFGYTKVSPKEKTKLVQSVFSDVSEKYDLMNDIMSLGGHRIWKRIFADIINVQPNDKIIDVGSGTGDIARFILKTKIETNLHLLDLNNKMLEIGKLNLNKKYKNISFHQGSAEKLKFKDNFFDKYIISFCLRNITNIEDSIKEAFRVIKPGGTYYCLEFSTPNTYIISKFYNSYKNNFIPLLGKIISQNEKSYRYLSESIDLFPNQKKLKKLLEINGFINVSYLDLFDGIVAIHKGYKV